MAKLLKKTRSMGKPVEGAPSASIGTVRPVPITQEMETSYLDYAMSVIISRALPDVRDGLKPVHRRILYTLHQMGLRSSAKHRKSAAIVGECFVRDTLIATSDGLIPIQDVRIGDRVYTQGGVRSVVQQYVMPPRPLLRIRTAMGLENTVTPSQPFKVIDQKLQFVWKLAKDIRAGDHIVSRQVYPTDVPSVALPKFLGHAKQLNGGIAYLLGQFLSDGHYEKNGLRGRGRIGFSSADLPVISYVQRILREEFAYDAAIEVRPPPWQGAKEMYAVRIQRGAINHYLTETFGIRDVDALTKRIPPQVFRSPPHVIAAFLSGLYDGDGSIHQTRRTIIYGTISPTLAHGILVLLHQLGMLAAVYPQHVVGREQLFRGKVIRGHHDLHAIEVNGRSAIALARILQLRSPRKSMRIQQIIASVSTRSWNVGVNAIPFASAAVFGELSKHHVGSGWYRDSSGTAFRSGIHYANGTKIRYAADLHAHPLTREQVDDWGIRTKLHRIGSPLAEQLDDICQDQLGFLEVIEITPASPETTYDLQVEGDHEFIANGMLAHNCLGKFHPHGDTAVYDAMVRMAQPWSMREMLVAGQGNMGSVDGDAPAAMRYTEAKLAPIAGELLEDIEKETVNFIPNYDATQQEPTVLPARLPNLLLNGTVGIAVGMATSIPPHNLGELCDAVIHTIDHPDASVEDLLKFVKGPDFPTGGIIYDWPEIARAYATGKGAIVCRAKAEIVEEGKGTQIIISEIPYAVNKATLLEHIAQLVQDKKIEGIRDLRDESSKGDVRVVVDLKKDAYPKKVLNRLFHSTELQATFHVNMLAIVDGIQPRVLNLKGILDEYLKHRKEVIRRRTQYDLNRAKDRAHILEGLKIAILHIDEVIATIKKSQDRDEARINLIKKFKLTEPQTNAILDMRLAQLANLERIKVETELKDKIALIKELEAILKSETRIMGVIKEEVKEVKDHYATPRRTEVRVQGVKEFRTEDLIPNVPAIVMVTKDGYLKRMAPDTFKTQGRGGKGVIGLTTKEEDVVDLMFATMTHADVLFFTTRGRVFQLKAYDIPEASRTAKGQALVNFLNLSPAEKVSAILPISDLAKDEKYLVMVTRNGVIKKVDIESFTNVRKSGLIAIKLRGDDLLQYVKPSTGHDEILIVSRQGQAIRFKEKDVRSMGRVAAGVRGMRLGKKDDVIVGMDIIGKSAADAAEVLVIMANGFGKRTKMGQYRITGRGGSGIKTAEVTAKTGVVVTAFVANSKAPPEDLIVISMKGQVIRLPYKEVSVSGRATQGVHVMRFKEESDEVASVTYV